MFPSRGSLQLAIASFRRALILAMGGPPAAMIDRPASLTSPRERPTRLPRLAKPPPPLDPAARRPPRAPGRVPRGGPRPGLLPRRARGLPPGRGRGRAGLLDHRRTGVGRGLYRPGRARDL